MSRFRQWTSSARAALARHPRFLVTAVVLMAAVLAAGAAAIAWFCYDVTAGLPGERELRGLGEMAQATTIYDAHDAPLFTIATEQRIEVPLARISPTLIKAVLAIEDQRFYDHAGVDIIRVAAAGLRNLQAGRRAEGGSTITQQLARQSFLTRDKTFRRKVKEMILAARLERKFSKNDILELYLNKVYFGDGLYGVEAAALGYFGVHARDLTVDRSALLAGLIQSPSTYAPTVNLDRAIARRNVVLQSMHASGAIDAQEYARARQAPVRLSHGGGLNAPVGLYFKEQIRRELVDRFGGARVAHGGLHVYTTIDPAVQEAAEEAVEQGLTAIEARRGYKHTRMGDDRDSENIDYLQGALVALDPASGEVRAMVGGRNFDDSSFNRATQAKRQPGSAFKPFVYAAALEAGYTPASVISNLNDPILTEQGTWVPEDEHSNAASLTLRSALRMSSNRAAVQLLGAIGIPRAVAYAQKLNVGTPPSVPSLALGAGEVTLLSLTSAYGAFADQGIVRQPTFIRRVTDGDGKTLFEAASRSQRAIAPETAFLMSSMLADVINSGTAYKARRAGFTLPAAGKTGTTNDYMDAWFVGFTPHLVTGVWVGFDQPKTIVSNGYAADLAVPIWTSFMTQATRNDHPDWLAKPDRVVAVNVCRISGKLPNAGCGSVETIDADGAVDVRSMVYTEYFVKGTQPTTICPLHPGGIVADAADAAAAGMAGTPGAPRPRATTRTTETTGAMGTSGTAPAGPSGPGISGGTAISGGTLPAGGSETPEQPKKKGFWKRVFGGGR